MFHTLLNALEETLFMVLASGVFTYLLGLPLAILLVVTRPEHLLPNVTIYKMLNSLTQIAQSVPALILVVTLVPLLHVIAGTGKGCVITLIPLTLATIPYFMRLCEDALLTATSKGLIETAIVMNANSFQIIWKILLPEARREILHNLLTCLIHLVGYSTITGVLGGGGLGSLVVHRPLSTLGASTVIAAIITLITIAMLIQTAGQYLTPRR